MLRLSNKNMTKTQVVGQIKDSVIEDLQSALLDINNALNEEGKKQLDNLKNLTIEIQIINEPVAEISDIME